MSQARNMKMCPYRGTTDASILNLHSDITTRDATLRIKAVRIKTCILITSIACATELNGHSCN